MKLLFPQATVNSSKWLPQKKVTMFVNDIKYLKTKLNKNSTINSGTKVFIWLNNDCMSVNGKKVIKQTPTNSIVLNNSKLASNNEIQAFINIPFSLINSISAHMRTFSTKE